MHKKYAPDHKFLEKYTNIKKLGQGGFGDVYLVKDESGQQSALKIIEKKKLQDDHVDLFEYLKSEIKCMEKVHHQNLVKLYKVEKDQQCYYMLLEYCDGGDLVKDVLQFPKKVFPMQTAVEYLSQVIKGLEKLHSEGYLHRDIKPQNVLIKNENGRKVLKIADFGFAKKAVQSPETVCGTQSYMSPQIFECGKRGIEGVEVEQYYGYEVDMWAFGVLFFNMLNKDMPFKIAPRWSIKEKFSELKNQSKNFSYKAAVEKTKLKLVDNCTPQIEDLFKKMFDLDPEKRIRFNQIRQHQVFRKYFPEASPQSKILYQYKYQSTLLKQGRISRISNSPTKLKPPSLQRSGSINLSENSNPEKEVNFNREKQIVRLQFQQIRFLWRFMENICGLESIIGSEIVNMTSYNLVKYYIYLIKQEDRQFTSAIYSQKYSKQRKSNWKALFEDNHFKQMRKENARKMTIAQQQLKVFYNKCKEMLPQINKKNEFFKYHLTESSQIKDIEDFYQSYRQSTSVLYSKIKSQLEVINNYNLYYELCTCCICHVFDQIYQNQEEKEQLFSVYWSKEKEKGPIFSFPKLEKYLMYDSSGPELAQLTKKIVEQYIMA